MQWRVVVITGCDSGFGKQLACRLLQESYRGIYVVACCLTASGQSYFKKKSTEITKRDHGLMTLQLDVTSASSIAQAKLEVEHLIGDLNSCNGLWAIVNNAGIVIPAAFELQPEADMRRVLEVNFFGVANCCRAFLPLLRRQPGARIINGASCASLQEKIFLTLESMNASFHSFQHLWTRRPGGQHILHRKQIRGRRIQ